ncbi:unnamed protein product [Prunus armeniaca]
MKTHSVIVGSHGAELAPSHLHRQILSLRCIRSIDYHRRPMILPLHLSSPKANCHHRRAFDGRRLQRSEPNAHMRLYDDLLANGYYSTRVWIGTPPQKFALIVDTGSSVTYVPCSDCQRCGSHQDPRFQPNSSSTYQLVKCNANCNCDEEGSKCTYKRQYAEGVEKGSSSIGVLGEDIISFGNEIELVLGHAVFGCENVETNDLYSQRADGVDTKKWFGPFLGQLSDVWAFEGSSSIDVLGEDIISFGNEIELVLGHAVFGCENVETGDLYSQRADGVDAKKWFDLFRGQLSDVWAFGMLSRPR